MDVVCAMVNCILYAVITMEVQATIDLVVACWRSAPGRMAAPDTVWRLREALCVFLPTYVLAYVAVNVLAPCTCYSELIAAGVAAVVNLAVTAYKTPRRPVAVVEG